MKIINIFTKQKAVIYCRCSRKSRKEHVRQKYICETFADKKKYKIVNEFLETITGNAAFNDRNILIDCITYCIKNGIKTIIISEVDRFSRNLQAAKDAIEMVKPFKIKFIFVNEMLDSSKLSHIEKILTNVEVSHYELKKIKYRLDSGRETFIKNGGKVGRKNGYKKTKEQMREDYPEVIKLLFEDDGYSLRKIQQKTGTSINTIRRVKDLFKQEYETK
jgi:DNA invertase Pin-like site-specific DNA recombinase